MKNFIHEVHRRSLWQVLGIYLAVSWIVLQVIDVLGNNIGLPEWVGPTALALLLVGLPIVIGTAFVQEGMTTRRRASAESRGDEAEPDVMSSASRPSGPHRLFTWRNALLGGGAAFALLGILTAGYLFLRAAGIGPAGTLVAQGVLEEGARVVLADFESSDPELADVVTGALRIDLLQSPTLRIVERSELSGALARMELDADAPITPNVARELAQREGYGAFIQGEIGTAGAGYVLTASIVGGEDWISLAGFRATARGEDDLIDAIESLSRDIRDKAGESLRSVQRAPPLERVTTSSIEALRTYTRAAARENAGDRPGAVELYERAIALDPEFGMAYRKLGVVLGNMRIRRTEQVEALRRAYELRRRLPEAEGLLAEAYYHSAVRGDRPATIRAYESLLEIDPDNRPALNNLSLLYRELDRLEEAEALLERALELEMFQVGVTNLAATRFGLGEDEAGLAALDMGAEELPRAESIFEGERIDHFIDRAEYELAGALTDAFEERFPGPRDVVRLANRRYVLDAVRGRLEAAEAWIERFDEAPAFSAYPVVMAASRASLLQARGESADAARTVLEAFADVAETRPPGERLYAVAVNALLEAGARSEGAALLAEWLEAVPEDELGFGGRDARREAEARLASLGGDVEEAVRRWEAYESACPGTCALTASLGLALLYDAAGDVDSAIAQYERYLMERGAYRGFLDASHRGPVLERLARLHDLQEAADRGAEYYRQFIELWSDADPALQPRVSAARQRLEALGASEGGAG